MNHILSHRSWGRILALGWAWVWGMFAGAGAGVAQALPPGCDSLFPYTCLSVSALHELRGPWVHSSGRESYVPFRLDGPPTATFEIRLPAQDSLAVDSLYLYFSGLGAEAELRLGDRYLGFHRHPFQPWTVAMAMEWLCGGEASLILTLRKGAGDTLLPYQFTGVFRPVYLMTRAQRQALAGMTQPARARADTVALVAPYFRRTGFFFDLYEAVFTFLPLRERGIRYVKYAFDPGIELRALGAQMGFVEVRELAAGTWVLPINAYPYEPRTLPERFPFWLDEAGNRTIHYGDGLTWGEKPDRPLPVSVHPALVLILMLPLLGALLIHILSPGFWAWQLALIRQPWLLADTAPIAGLNASGLWFLLLLKTLLQALSLALLMYYVAYFHQWEVMNGFQDWSLLNRVFYPAERLTTFLLWALAIFGGSLLLRLLVLRILGGAFRIKGLLSGILDLEVMGAYPLVLVLPYVVSGLIFSGQIWPGLPVALLIGLGGMYWLRRAYVMYQGLGRQFSFSYGMKILYICTFNVIPYIFWL